MNRYQLAKLVEWAGTLESRKRLQKVVYMLQAAGCPLDADFILHRYGPYSQDVAQLTDEMVGQSLLVEREIQLPNGSKFSYGLPELVRQQITEFEMTSEGRTSSEALQPFKERAEQLLRADLRELEYASTILYFQRQGHEWPNAVILAERFKNTPEVRNALPLAQQVVA